MSESVNNVFLENDYNPDAFGEPCTYTMDQLRTALKRVGFHVATSGLWKSVSFDRQNYIIAIKDEQRHTRNDTNKKELVTFDIEDTVPSHMELPLEAIETTQRLKVDIQQHANIPECGVLGLRCKGGKKEFPLYQEKDMNFKSWEKMILKNKVERANLKYQQTEEVDQSTDSETRDKNEGRMLYEYGLFDARYQAKKESSETFFCRNRK